MRLRTARKAAGLTQAQLADRAGAGITQYAISNLELGRAIELSVAEQQALAAALGVAVQDLEADEQSRPPPALTLRPDRLRVARKAARLTQPQLAAKTGFRQSTISRLETGGTGISLEGVQNLAAALGVSVKYLLGETDDTLANHEDFLARIHEHYDIPPGLRELAAAENLLAELKIEPNEWQVLISVAEQWQNASLTPRDGWVQILLALRTASILRPLDHTMGRVR